jgi:hypothetical protein
MGVVGREGADGCAGDGGGVPTGDDAGALVGFPCATSATPSSLSGSMLIPTIKTITITVATIANLA